jgi:hypothetical protein
MTEGGLAVREMTGCQEVKLSVRGVTPAMGSIVVFPHGDNGGAIVHEGSELLNGIKCIIRTDVLYEKK